MTLVYRAILHDSDGAITRSVEPLVSNWLAEKGLAPQGFALSIGMSTPLSGGDQPAWIRYQQISSQLSGGTAVLSRIRLVEERPQGRWITTVTWSRPPPPITAQPHESVTTDGAHWVWIDLEHETVGGRPPETPGSPRLVRNLMAAGEAYDASLPLTADPLVITHGHVDELDRYIRDPSRNVPVIVFSHDPSHAYDQRRLSSNLARDLAGVAAVFVLDDSATTSALEALLPEELSVYGGALRTYLPGATQEGDAATRHRILGRVSLTALGQRAFPAVKDQILRLSAQRPAPADVLSLRATKEAPAPVPSDVLDRQTIHADPLLRWITSQVERLRSARRKVTPSPPYSELSGAQRALAREIDQLVEHTRQLDREARQPGVLQQDRLRATEAELIETEQDRQLLNDLLTEASRELEATNRLAVELRDDYEFLQLELAESLRSHDSAARRMRWLDGQLRQAGQVDAMPDATTIAEVPDSVAEVVLFAREALKHVVIGPTDADAAELDIHPGASLFAAKTWDALVALDAFALARTAGQFAGNFYSWCQEPPSDAPALSAAAVAMVESETVSDSPDLRAKRTFGVEAMGARGHAVYMPAHIKLVKRGAPAPRLHFYDDCAGDSGAIHVGYIGPHLPTAKF